jgi:pilus assembly protein CpaB
VFAVNEVFEKTDEKEKSLMAKTISLLVTPAQAEMVALANELGEIRLVIRSADDDDMAETAGVTPMDLFENHSGKAPLAASSAASAAADVASNLLGLLNRQAKPALPSLGEPPVVVEPPKEETWTVTLLQGDKIDRVEIREGELPRIITGEESNSSQPASTIEPAVDETSLLEGLQPDPAPEEEPAVE